MVARCSAISYKIITISTVTKLIYQFEFQNDTLQSGCCDHFPFPIGFGNLHGWGGGRGHISHHHPNTQLAQKVFVFGLLGPGVFSRDLDHAAQVTKTE